MWKFLILTPADEVQIIMVGGRDLQHAFEQFVTFFWHPTMTTTIGVWRNAALVARVLYSTDPQTGDPMPILEEIAP